MPAFANYLARGRISEAINYAQGCKTGFLEYYATNGAFPTTNSQANCPSITTPNVQGVTVGNRGIVVQLSTGNTIPAAVRGQYIYIQPLNNANPPALASNGQTIVSWACSLGASGTGNAAATAQALDFVPAICRNQPK
ncbi:pilin [Limnobacter humi]|uniref:Pilin n=1 Tax=Limnobacter humi TaxID=1778671 RepID=A0ABT1WDP2_9BURK|nr:pilin [Limnobacter humi]